jgi:predicted nuclease of restriction endonuclease-like (RecB) superfamily
VSVLSNWHLGRLIHTETLRRGRAEYGKQILATLSQKLVARFGVGFDESSLNRMVKFAKEFSEEIVVSFPPQVGWSHVKELLPLSSPEARLFYVDEVGAKNLSVRDLRRAVGRKAFERREIANSQIPEGSAMPLDAFKDPMLLDMLTLKDSYLEADLEQAILRDLEQFLLEVGRGFAFVGRQVRMPMGNRDYQLDLLFYSRPLSRLVAVELKIGEFSPEHEGQMRFYLKWLDRHERGGNEGPPIGLILCTSADRDQVELMELHKDNIVVAEYWTELLPKKELEDRLQAILRDASERMARRTLTSDLETSAE